MNKVIISGNLTKDAETRSNTNTTVISFTVATKRNFKNAKGEYDSDFINCKYFRKEDNISKYLLKGTKVLIEGKIQTGSYEAQDGTKKYTTEVIVDNLELLGSKKENTEGQAVEKQEPQQESDPYKEFGSEVHLTDDDLPF